jgi:hypothetical protein
VSEKQPRLEELVAVQPLKSKHLLVRPIGPPVGYMMHWITIASSKGIVNIPKLVPNYDPETDTIDDTIVDPYKSISNEVSTSRKYLVPVIVRDLQDSEPRKKPPLTPKELKTGFKEPDSESWTPVRIIVLPPSVIQLFVQVYMIQNLAL